jgi:hypothetical protein
MWKCVYILYCIVHTLLQKYDFVLTVQYTCKQHLLNEKLTENVLIVCSVKCSVMEFSRQSTVDPVAKKQLTQIYCSPEIINTVLTTPYS